MIKLLGKIISNPTFNRNICYYIIETEGRQYKVVSKDYQAALDHIFMNAGQFIEICGTIKDDILYVIDSKIILRTCKGR